MISKSFLAVKLDDRGVDHSPAVMYLIDLKDDIKIFLAVKLDDRGNGARYEKLYGIKKHMI